MIYQDTWVNGCLTQKGIRDCEGRYNIIKPVAENILNGFSVLDVGANMCYFGLRLIEDFNCRVMAFEFNSFDMRDQNVKKNKTKKLMLLKRKLSIGDFDILAYCCRFDLLLAMSVLHHLPGNATEWINAFRRISKNTIVEFALDDSSRVEIRKDYKIPADGIVLGYGDSHLQKDFKRPIVLLKND